MYFLCFVQGNLKVVTRKVTMWDDATHSVGIIKLPEEPYYDVLFSCNTFIGIRKYDASKYVPYYKVDKSVLEEI